jgi:hypothetical protein
MMRRMSASSFGPRFVPSTAARRFVALLDDDRTELMPDRLLRDRADTVRIAPPTKPQLVQLFLDMPALMKLMLAGIVVGSLFAIVYAYRPGIG